MTGRCEASTAGTAWRIKRTLVDAARTPSHLGSVAALVLSLVASAPARAACDLPPNFVDHQITGGIFRPGRFEVLPSPVPEALILIFEGERNKAAAIFERIVATPELYWRLDEQFVTFMLGARTSTWLLNGCPG